MLLMTSLLGACHRHELGLLPQATALSCLYHFGQNIYCPVAHRCWGLSYVTLVSLAALGSCITQKRSGTPRSVEIISHPALGDLSVEIRCAKL